jgi:hypothetical protein
MERVAGGPRTRCSLTRSLTQSESSSVMTSVVWYIGAAFQVPAVSANCVRVPPVQLHSLLMGELAEK